MNRSGVGESQSLLRFLSRKSVGAGRSQERYQQGEDAKMDALKQMFGLGQFAGACDDRRMHSPADGLTLWTFLRVGVLSGLMSGRGRVRRCPQAFFTEIYLCNVCSCQEILRRNGRGRGGAPQVGEEPVRSEPPAGDPRSPGLQAAAARSGSRALEELTDGPAGWRAGGLAGWLGWLAAAPGKNNTQHVSCASVELMVHIVIMVRHRHADHHTSNRTPPTR
jgi:hypothetical protein